MGTLPDGSVVRATSERLLADGTRIAIFPPLPPDAKALTFKTTSVVKEETRIPAMIPLSLAGKLDAADVGSAAVERINIGQQVAVGRGAIRIDSVEIGQGQVVVRIASVSQTESVRFGGLAGVVTLRSGLKSYPIAARHDSFQKIAAAARRPGKASSSSGELRQGIWRI
jgi:hypothetical protein